MTPAPVPPPAVVAPVTFGRFNYGDPTQNASRYPWQVLQGDHAGSVAAVRAAGGQTVVRYATPVAYRVSDPQGFTQCLPPAMVQPSWLLTDVTGRQITRSSNGDIMLDVGSVNYQKAAAAHLVALCQSEGWDGIMLDEINQRSSYSYPIPPAKYSTDAAWQAAQLAFVQVVATALRAAGKQCYVNLGSDPNAWAKAVVGAVDGSCAEYFIGTQDTSVPTPSTANGEWLTQVGWAQWCEQQGKWCVFHATTSDPAIARYALGSYLLVTEGHGVFAAAVKDYGDDVWTSDFDAALKLGQPTGANAKQGATTYSRQFEHGTVTVDPTALTATIALS